MSLFPVYVQHPVTGREFWIRDEKDHARLIVNCRHQNVALAPNGLPFCTDCLSACMGCRKDGCSG